MRKFSGETLGSYVKRVLQQKQLKLRDVERRSQGQITNGYISGIMNDKIKNFSLDKLKALAAGLDVDPHTILDAALGESHPFAIQAADEASPDAHWLLETMQAVVESPELMGILEELRAMSVSERETVLKAVQSLSARHQEAQGKSSKVSDKKRHA
jgi:transcriptional regulator with XRE-family HTH domain